MTRWINALKDKRGFTLMEILVAVVIIGVLGAVAAQYIKGVVQDSKKKALANQLSTIQAAVDRWYANRNQWPTLTAQPSTTTPAQLDSTTLFNDGYLRQINTNHNDFAMTTGITFGVTAGGTVYAIDAAAMNTVCDATINVFTAYNVAGSLTCNQLK